ncbi:hypothetical protein M3Y94_00659000 [Aphelenchoides besseyi]|nr:hypothetical protein M3Y94_00659000 [Aphelenchoides besseyi]
MLSVKSPVFRAMFDKETEEQKSGVVKIKGFEATMIKAMLVYIYKNEVKDVESIAAHLLPVADCYQVNSLVEKCSNSLVANLTVKNILSILELALERPHLENFRERVMKFAHRNFKEICKLTECDYFLTQHPEIAIKLLKLSHSIS